MNSKQKALALAETLSAKKGAEVRILDLRMIHGFTDFFVIATGTSGRHVKTLARATQEKVHALGERTLGVEGERVLRWVLIDVDDVIVHVFQSDAREFYSLERLWGEAEALDLQRAAEA